MYGEKERGDHRYDSAGPLGLEPDADEYASDDEPTAQARLMVGFKGKHRETKRRTETILVFFLEKKRYP